MFSKERAAPHLGGSVPGFDVYNDPQARASTAYSLFRKSSLSWNWVGKMIYLEKFRPSREQDLGKSLIFGKIRIFPKPMLSSWG